MPKETQYPEIEKMKAVQAESQAIGEYLEELRKRGIQAVPIPDGDKDHAPEERKTRVRGQVVPQEPDVSTAGEQPALPLTEELQPEA